MVDDNECKTRCRSGHGVSRMGHNGECITMIRLAFLLGFLLLSGCGESVSEKLAREDHDTIAKDQDREIVRLQERIEKLERKP